MTDTQKNSIKASQEITLKDVFTSISKWIKYFRSKWVLLLVVSLVGVMIGYCYSKYSKIEYQAKTSLIVDDNSQSQSDLGILGALVGGTEANPGLFSGDNLMWLYTSDNMLQKTLLTQDTATGKLLLNKFIAIDKKIKKIISKTKTKTFYDNVMFEELDQKQMYVISTCCNLIRNKYLKVDKEKNAASIISVTIISSGESFSKLFCDYLVSNVNSFYISTKTQKTLDQIKVLERKVQEYDRDINRNMYEAAGAIQSIPNPNQNLQVIKVEPQRRNIDVQVNSTLYSQMVLQLEASKVALSKETPILQIIDKSQYPLLRVKPSLILWIFVLGIGMPIVTIGILFIKKYYKDIINM